MNLEKQMPLIDQLEAQKTKNYIDATKLTVDENRELQTKLRQMIRDYNAELNRPTTDILGSKSPHDVWSRIVQRTPINFNISLSIDLAKCLLKQLEGIDPEVTNRDIENRKKDLETLSNKHDPDQTLLTAIRENQEYSGLPPMIDYVFKLRVIEESNDPEEKKCEILKSLSQYQSNNQDE